MSFLFVSDFHLSNNNPVLLERFLFFLNREVIQSSGLYILGDFFEYWIGDDDSNPFYKRIFLEFRKIREKNIPCYFIYGNRDFLIGKKLLQRNGIKLIFSEQILHLYGKKILILHGDVFFNNFFYKSYKKIVFNKIVQKIFLYLPLRIRRKIALRIRKRSKFINKKKVKFHICKNSVINKFKKEKVDYIIHGHFHHQFVNKIFIGKKKYYHICLSDWSDYGSFVKIDSKNIKLVKLVFY